MVTRADLSAGQQAVQAAHAAIDFVFEHPSRAGPWHEVSNYLAILVAESEAHLKQLVARCESALVDYTVFREPDLDNQITAIAMEPSKETQRLAGKFPLLFQDKIN